MAQLVERLEESRFLAVVGPSGSGKSSVVGAGSSRRCEPARCPAPRPGSSPSWTPGSYPLEELEAALLRIAVNPPASLLEQLVADDRGLLRAVKRALPPGRSELLLIVDQLEELFTLVEDERVRAQVCDDRAGRARPRSRLRVIVTLRADFYDRPLLYRGFAELVRDGVGHRAAALARGDRAGGLGPARGVGVELGQGLLAEIVADVLDEPVRYRCSSTR